VSVRWGRERRPEVKEGSRRSDQRSRERHDS
jgi:hypothetical protein